LDGRDLNGVGVPGSSPNNVQIREQGKSMNCIYSMAPVCYLMIRLF